VQHALVRKKYSLKVLSLRWRVTPLVAKFWMNLMRRSKQVLFRKNSTEAPATFLPKDIRGFGLGDRETFTSFTVPFRMGLNESANTKKMVETRFLRLIEPGTIQLFKLYVSDINYALYVRKNDLPLEPLTLVINTIAGAEGNQQQKILNSDTVTFSKSLIQGDARIGG
jgi:hypothetical protein